MSLQKEFIDILRCPKRACRGDLAESGDLLKCKICDDEYPVKDGIPILFPNSAQSPDIHQRHWDLKDNAQSYAKKYDTYLKKQGNPWGQYTHISELNVIKKLKVKLGIDLSKKIILDLGCGNGRLLSDYPEGGQKIGLDASLYLLQATKAREPGYWLVCGQVEDLPFKDAISDFTVSIRVFQHLRAQEQTFAEMVRVTRPSGHVVVEAYNKLNLKELYKRFRMLPRMQKWNPWGLAYDRYNSYREFEKLSRKNFIRTQGYAGAGWGFHFYLFDIIKFRRFAPDAVQKTVFNISYFFDDLVGAWPFFSKTMEKIVYIGSVQRGAEEVSFSDKIQNKFRAKISLKRAENFKNILENRNYALAGNDRQHLERTLNWLKAAQDATSDGGVSRGFSLFWDRKFRKSGWQPSYPETTGYIIPTVIFAAKILNDKDLLRRAKLMADWELALMNKDGWIQAGNIAKNPKPEVFDTGQVIRGLLAAYGAFEEAKYKDAALRAGNWMVGNNFQPLSYYAYAAAPLAELGVKFGKDEYKQFGIKIGNSVIKKQNQKGWYEGADFKQFEGSLLHTIAYTIDGMWDLGEVLCKQEFMNSAKKALDGVLSVMDERGFVPGSLDKEWKGTVEWACLTGIAQIGVTAIKAYKKYGDKKYLECAERAKEYLKVCQNNLDPEFGGLGAIWGSWPISGGYEPYQALNWPVKYFADLLMDLHELN